MKFFAIKILQHVLRMKMRYISGGKTSKRVKYSMKNRTLFHELKTLRNLTIQ